MSNLNELNRGLKWYVAHTYSGYEKKVSISLNNLLENRPAMAEKIKEIKILTDTVQVEKGEEVKEKEVLRMPSYIFIKMEVDDESWHAVRNITGVTGFVGPGSVPTPLSDEEVANLGLEGDGTPMAEETLAYKEGDLVKIVGGNIFAGFTGVISNVSEDQKTVTALVKTGVRSIPVELDVANIEIVKE